MTMSQLTEIRRLVERIATDTDNTLSGGHMHISRTGRQTPARWYWALEALDETQCEALNMRHMTDTRWCELIHGDYCGKDTAINDTHRHTIEFRTFGRGTTTPPEDSTPPSITCTPCGGSSRSSPSPSSRPATSKP